MKRALGQSSNYAFAAIVAAAVIFGIWLYRSSGESDADSNSLADQKTADPAPASLLHSASPAEATDDPSDASIGSDSESASAPAGGTIESESDHYVPIPVPGEFAGIVEREGRLSAFHERLEREPEDPEWALPLERELEDFLSELLDPSLIALKLIECRSDSCEILAVGYGEHATRTWFEALQALYESGMLEQWFRAEGPGQFNGGCGSVDLGPGIAGLMCEFSRAVSQTNDEDSTQVFSLTAPYPDGVEFTLVPVPDDFVSLYETNAEVYDFHRALQAEEVDHSWAPFVEKQIVEHYSSIPELESVNYHHVECRMTRCEVQLTIYDPQVAMDWTLELKNFDDQPWHDLEFAIYNAPADDDLIRIVWLLRRKNSN